VAAREDSSDGAEEQQDRGFVFHYAVTHDRAGIGMDVSVWLGPAKLQWALETRASGESRQDIVAPKHDGTPGEDSTNPLSCNKGMGFRQATNATKMNGGSSRVRCVV
jgi:hypothetical protein